MHKFLAVPTAALMLSLATFVHAHGDSTHGAQKHLPPNLDPVEKAFGRTGDPNKVTRTVRIDSLDTMRYKPAQITVHQGDTIRLIVRNAGKVMHETVLGTMTDLQEHAQMMRKFPGMEHEEPFMVHVGPGQTGEMIWQFTQAGDFHFGCLIPGHFEAGMIGQIKVVGR